MIRNGIVRDTFGMLSFLRLVRRQMVVDKFDKKLRNSFNELRFFMYHFSDNSQSIILCPS